jgi:hypothetical protein
MRTPTSSVYTHPAKPSTPSTPSYPPPSVPLSVYRELAAELQAAETKLDLLTTKNQQLTQENQLLRQEIIKVVQSFLHLQKLVDTQAAPTAPTAPVASTKSSDRPAPHPTPDVKVEQNRSVKVATPRQQVPRPQPATAPKVTKNKKQAAVFSVPVVEMVSPMPEPVLIEEQEVRYYSSAKPDSQEISGWWLFISIVLIMLTAFGAGYLVVRPLFEHQSR